MHACIHTVHTCIHIYIHTSKQTYINTCITLHYITLHDITLHYSAAHCITLHYTTVQYITYKQTNKQTNKTNKQTLHTIITCK